MDNTEEGGDDVKSSCPLRLGLHTCYNGCYKELRTREGKRISKRQSQFGLWAATGLQPAHMKSELLVIPNQHVGVNAFPGLVHTARQAMGVGNTQSRCANRKEAAA